jgi:hypothetical protein
MSSKLQVIQGGKVKPSAVPKPNFAEAYGRWSRAMKPIGLATLAWELGVSQNTLAHAFMEIVQESAWRGGFQSGRASLWTKAAA